MVSQETMIKRIMKRSKTSKRADDNEESIKKRLKVYRDFHFEIMAAFEHKIREVNLVVLLFLNFIRNFDVIKRTTYFYA